MYLFVMCVVLTSFSDFGFWNCVDAYLLFFIPFKAFANILISFLDSRRLCAYWEFNFEQAYVFNDFCLITFTSDDKERKCGFVLSYVERKYNTTEEQTSMTTTYPATDVQTDTSSGITTTGVASSSDTISVSKTSTIHSTATIETTSTTLTDSTTNILQGTFNYNSASIAVQCNYFNCNKK